MLVFLLIPMLKKAPEHETVGFSANSDAQKRPRSTRLFAFLLIRMLKKALEHETVGIFSNLGAQKGARD